MPTSPDRLFLDLIDPANRVDPYPVWARLREQPVARQESGEYFITHHADVRSLFQDPRMTADRRKLLAEDDPGRDAPAAFALQDAPQHDLMRAQTMLHFGPPRRPGYVDSLRGDIIERVHHHLDSLEGRTTFDLVSEISGILPVEVISTIAGFPLDDSPMLGRWSHLLVLEPEFLDHLDHDGSIAAEQAQAAQKVAEYFGRLIADKRQHPDDTLVSGIANAPASEAMSEIDLVQTTLLLLVGGHETTSSLIGNAVVQLLRNPEQWDVVRQDPGNVRPLVEETLRYDPPIQFRTRFALEDIEVSGTHIPAGSTLLLGMAAANRDPLVWEDPDDFRVRRDPVPHMAFGNGPHYCFGAPLARVEADEALRALTSRLKGPRLAEVEYGLSPETRGPARVLLEVEEVLPRAAAA